MEAGHLWDTPLEPREPPLVGQKYKASSHSKVEPYCFSLDILQELLIKGIARINTSGELSLVLNVHKIHLKLMSPLWMQTNLDPTKTNHCSASNYSLWKGKLVSYCEFGTGKINDP